MIDKIEFSQINDPTNFNAEGGEALPFKFASNEDAKAAARFFNRMQVEIRRKALEEAAAVCDEASDLHANGNDWMDAAEYCASEIRALSAVENGTE